MKNMIFAIRNAFVVVAFVTLTVFHPPIAKDAAWAQETACKMAGRHSEEACEAAGEALQELEEADEEVEDYEEARQAALALVELCLDRAGM